jgi:hypothetical protein
MHPIIERDVMQARVAELHRRAERDRTARTASRTPHTRREKRGTKFMSGRMAILARRALATLSALIPFPSSAR